MATYDTYSKRNKLPNDVFGYDLTNKLKIQIIHIWTNFFTQLPLDFRRKLWDVIHGVSCEEFGKKTLLEDGFRRYDDQERVEYYFENKATAEESMDIIEIVFRYVLKSIEIWKSFSHYNINLNYKAEEAVKDLNIRFLENSVGYEFQQDMIIRIDNSLLHKEIIVPAFNFINSVTFKNVNDEFLSAHLHYRNKLNRECLVSCLQAFETTMKIICFENQWPFSQNDTANKLIEICFRNKLIPDYLQTQLSSLRSILESGIPTLRNRLGGHGQGVNKITVPDHYASYMLHITGAAIQFLILCQKEIKSFN